MAEVDAAVSGDPFSSNSNTFNSSSSSSSNALSQNTHRRFPNVASYVSELGGDKGSVIEKVLIANNGNAAVKAIRSIRRWAYDVFGDEKAISFVVMATPEDLKANAEYIRMGDVIVDVPGGSNNHNYANVTLIVELARLHGVHAVWAGWGHASENPVLPDTLAQSQPTPIKFIGPRGPPMRALGDKIGSTIIAQSAGVPCIAWNGQDITAEYDVQKGSLPDEVYEKASIASATEALEAAKSIGFPVMIKASEGGGGKGIRRVDQESNVMTAYRQVCGEVPGSPIFIMKLSQNSRHLEVQLLADEYGNAVALNGRDCSVQRRHQKIIEEGPPVAATPQVWTQMERAAVSLAKAVGYTNAGTVEYLYSEPDHKFYFLELNPRLQVEHPVTEMITRVNLPAAQLQVAMGIPLYNIPEIRELYGRDRFDSAPQSPSAVIDFDNSTRVPTNGHCIAVRITAENAEAGFKPTSGVLTELNFRSTANVWGYFSTDSSGSIHEFADSQFGHLFANGNDREQARRNMVLALKELSIRGDISTTVDYISKLIELDDFIHNNISTGWLDAIIQSNVDGMGAAEQVLKRSNSIHGKDLNDHTYVIIGATITAFDLSRDGENQFLGLLEKGQLPSQTLLAMTHSIELIFKGVKYKMICTRNGPNLFELTLNNSSTSSVSANVRLLSDGGYLIDIGGKSHVAYLTSKGDVASGMRLNVGGANIAFSPDYDPTSLRTDVAGKLVKKLVPDGARVKKGEPYGEIEAMKMFMPLKVEEAGVVTWNMNEGATLVAGDLLASLELDNPENVVPVTVFDGEFDVFGWGDNDAFAAPSTGERPHLLFRSSIELLKGGMAGFVLSDSSLESAMRGIEQSVKNPLLPVFEIEEQLSVLNGRIPAELFSNILTMLNDFKERCAQTQATGVQLRFASEKVLQLISSTKDGIGSAAETMAFETLVKPLLEATIPYTKSRASGIPGSERVMLSFLDILRNWVTVERWFSDGKSYADAVDNLRKAQKENPALVLDVCRAHAGLSTTTSIVLKIIDLVTDASRIDPQRIESLAFGPRVSVCTGAESLSDAMPSLAEIASIKGYDEYSQIALRARKLLLQESEPSVEQRKRKFWDAAQKLALSTPESSKEVAALLEEHQPIQDIVYPLLKMANSAQEEVGLLELLTLVLYRAYALMDFVRDYDNRIFKFSFLNKAPENAIRRTSVNSMSDLTRIASSSALLEEGVDDFSSDILPTKNKERIAPNTLRIGALVLVEKPEDLTAASHFDKVLERFSGSALGLVNVLYVVVTSGILDEDDMDETAKQCEDVLKPVAAKLEQSKIRRVSFIFNQKSMDEVKEFTSPAVFTYRCPEYVEEVLSRNIEPSQVHSLDLNRIAVNFRCRKLASRHTTTCFIHMYEAYPKMSAVAKDKKANRNPRVFARALSFLIDFKASSFERLLVDALNTMDVVNLQSKTDNHLFINLVGESEKLVLDPVVVEQVIVDILKRYSERIGSLGIAEVETRIACCLGQDSPPIALRLVASNPTGYVHVMSTYVEASDETGGDLVFKLIGGAKASMASSADSSWEGLNVNTPYPLTRTFDAQRKAALRSSDTLYCYDIPALFEAAIERQWADTAQEGSLESGIRAAGRPLMVMYTQELVVEKTFIATSSAKWTMEDYLNGELEMKLKSRGAGANDVGMVAWLMTLKTVEYPEGRQVVLVANDITHKAGSFGTREDVVFKMASEYAREHRIPRLFVAANSGARIGLAEGVRKAFKVAFKDPSNPENGFDFLYVTEGDYEKLTAEEQEVIAEKTTLNGETVYRLTDIIGKEPDLGVENLKGSGLIAGETSAAYDDIFTMTIVLGRTVGIGAYLVRLGQRTIQKTTASPIILTGYQALNKLMGVDVYSTNDQLGGPGIMYPNGISHIIESDHLAAVKAAVDWLSYVPAKRGGLLPITDIRGVEEIDRTIDFTPSSGVPYDPRMLLAGGEDDMGNWQSGFFDKGSFTETLAGWAKTVIVGRARLGGIPMGVVITENRTAEAVKPADPADVKASEAVIQQAGCVWFPNSAYKTAQAINDFRTEDLPLIVFANWRGFSGGQRDMFDEVLKYGSLIVDAFVAYQQPVFVFIPPCGEIRGGAWVVLDASINPNVMEMYASSGTARGGVLEANGAASVKYRTKDLLLTMHRLDDTLLSLDKEMEAATTDEEKKVVKEKITKRERSLLPVYEQIAVQFCELHDTPGRMKAVGVIEQQVEWKKARSFFYWRLRRKLAEFDLRSKIMDATEVGRSVKSLNGNEASTMIKQWFVESAGASNEPLWANDKAVLHWMAAKHDWLEQKVVAFTRECVVQEVFQVMTAGGGTAQLGTAGIVEGIRKACESMDADKRKEFKQTLYQSLFGALV